MVCLVTMVSYVNSRAVEHVLQLFSHSVRASNVTAAVWLSLALPILLTQYNYIPPPSLPPSLPPSTVSYSSRRLPRPLI